MIWKLMFLIYIIGCFVILGIFEYHRKQFDRFSVGQTLVVVMLWPAIVVLLLLRVIKYRREE